MTKLYPTSKISAVGKNVPHQDTDIFILSCVTHWPLICITFFRPRGLWLAYIVAAYIIVSCCALPSLSLLLSHKSTWPKTQLHCRAEAFVIWSTIVYTERAGKKGGYSIMMEVKIMDCGEGPSVCLSINLKITPIFTRASFWQLCIRLKAGIVTFLFFFFEPSRQFFPFLLSPILFLDPSSN